MMRLIVREATPGEMGGAMVRTMITSTGWLIGHTLHNKGGIKWTTPGRISRKEALAQSLELARKLAYLHETDVLIAMDDA